MKLTKHEICTNKRSLYVTKKKKKISLLQEKEGNKMAQYHMFGYALIILLSQFLVKKAEITNIPCVSKDDCPEVVKPLVIKCVDHFCEYFWLNLRGDNHLIETMRSNSNN